MTGDPTLILQVPRGGTVDRSLAEQPPARVASGEVAVERGPTDAEGNLEAPAAGQVVLSVLSPEALRREADEVRRVIARAGESVEPLVVVVEAAQELRDDELAAVVEAATQSPRAVIVRVVRDA
ncbi:MAG TPA: hypothetical protein VG388_09280 [Solirubrobacteraceae bacterium]|nr:hypothetical protein [Solirubrobacteraceae bacterium]